ISSFTNSRFQSSLCLCVSVVSVVLLLFRFRSHALDADRLADLGPRGRVLDRHECPPRDACPDLNSELVVAGFLHRVLDGYLPALLVLRLTLNANLRLLNLHVSEDSDRELLQFVVAQRVRSLLFLARGGRRWELFAQFDVGGREDEED